MNDLGSHENTVDYNHGLLLLMSQPVRQLNSNPLSGSNVP
jgi:hypothetical protein